MSKRHVYNGVYKRSNTPRRPFNTSNQSGMDLEKFTYIVLKYLRMVYSAVVANYTAIVTIAIVILLALHLPVSRRHKKNQLNAMKKILDQMTEDVTRAEVACLTTVENLCSLCDEQTETTQELRDVSMCTSRGLFKKRSEPVQVEKKIGFFRRIFSLNRNVSRKEIAIMSIIYTDSFE